MSAAVIPLAFDGADPVAASLPELIDRARRRLIEARSSAEALEAKHIAEAALHYATVTRAAAETHVDCLRIITPAEMRMAEEVDRGQANGTVARRGGDRQSIARTSDNASETLYRDLGIDRRRASEWRAIQSAGRETVEEAIAEALSQGRAPKKSDIIKHVRGTFGSGNTDWFTPPEYIEAARQVLGVIDLDPASHPIAQCTIKAARIFTRQDDGLAQEWRGRVWLNPPYAQPLIAKFVAKLVVEVRNRRVDQALLLTHNYADTTWFHNGASVAQALCFTRGRIKFVNPRGTPPRPTQGQTVFYIGPDPSKFRTVFNEFGLVLPAAWPDDNAAASLTRTGPRADRLTLPLPQEPIGAGVPPGAEAGAEHDGRMQ